MTAQPTDDLGEHLI